VLALKYGGVSDDLRLSSAMAIASMIHININREASVVIRFPQPRHRDFTLHSTWELIQRKTRKPQNRIPDVMQKKNATATGTGAGHNRQLSESGIA
jgi:hypothetical protein